MIEYKRVVSACECTECDKMLTELIKLENQFDNLTSTNFTVTSFYESTLKNKDNVIFLAKEKNNFVGFIFAKRTQSKNKLFKKYIIEIEALFVQEAYRHKKVASSLLQKIDEWARTEFIDYVLEISAVIQNEPAIKCYSSFGFKPKKIIFTK